MSKFFKSMLVYQKQRESIAATTLIRYTFYLVIKKFKASSKLTLCIECFLD